MATFGFLSTYPPTRCGLATFTSALASAMALPGQPEARVVRVDDLVPTGPATPGERTVVVGDLRPGAASSRAAAAAHLDDCDVVVVQHEYGIYGGLDGDEILDILERINAPTIVVLHTVLEHPSAHQRWLLDRIGGLATAVVVMTRAARTLLAAKYAVSGFKVHVIPHGVVDLSVPAAPAGPHRPTLLTWGLLGPGKGLEWGIRALALLGDLDPAPRYLICGQTHPKVLAAQGETYRSSLMALAAELGVERDVVFDARYRTVPELAALVAEADVVVLPYDSTDQTTSGVLAESVAAGRPVVATRFPHSIELLEDAGTLVEHRDEQQLADAIRSVLAHADPSRPRTVAVEPSASWAAVAASYRELAQSLRSERAA